MMKILAIFVIAVFAKVQADSCQQSAVVCETDFININCPSGSITIISAFWGRQDGQTCGTDACSRSLSTCATTALTNTQCSADRTATTNKMKAACDGKDSCAIRANTTMFSDPCAGTYKYAVVVYQCDAVDGGNGGKSGSVATTSNQNAGQQTVVESSCLKTSYVCEWDYLNLNCSAGVINVQDGFYGRTSATICGVDACSRFNARDSCVNTNLKLLTCSASTALIVNILKSRCNGKTSCSIRFTNTDLQGDPCVGTYKYGYASYTCDVTTIVSSQTTQKPASNNGGDAKANPGATTQATAKTTSNGSGEVNSNTGATTKATAKTTANGSGEVTTKTSG